MALVLFFVFLVVPFLELYVIIQVAGVIGTGWTLALLVSESVLGAWLCKREGAGVLRRINRQLAESQLPTTEVVDGALILLAGALMVTPGFLTDILGFVLLIPPTRAVVRNVISRSLRRRIERAAEAGSDASFRVIRVTNFGPTGSPSGDSPNRGFTHDWVGREGIMDADSRETIRSDAAVHQLEGPSSPSKDLGPRSPVDAREAT